MNLFDVLPDAVCVVNKQGMLLQANPAFYENIAKEDRTIGKLMLEDLIHTADRNKLSLAFIDVLMKRSRIPVGRCRTLTFEGDNEFPVFRQYDWVLAPGDDAAESVIASGRIVSARERIEADVEQEQELLDFFQNAPIALHWLSDKGIIIWANNTELQTLGYTAEEYIGQPVMKFCPDEETLVLEIFKQLGSGNTIRDVPVRFRAKNGDIKYLLIDSNVNYNVDGSFRHTRCFIRDDTSRIVRESVSKYERDIAAARARDKDAFYRNIFMEMQNPVNRLTHESGSGTGSDAAAQVQATLDFMLIATNIEAGQSPQLEELDVDLVVSLNELVKENVPCARGIEIKLRTHNIPKFVTMDTCVVTHILQPLINFVLAHAPDNSQLDVCVFHAVQYFTFKLEFSTRVHFSADMIFKNFNQYYANNAAIDGFAGHGLGIFVASSLIQTMNGTLEFYSELCDAVFQFNLPLKIANSAANYGSVTPRELRWESLSNSVAAAAHLVSDTTRRPGTATTVDTTTATSVDEIEFTMPEEELEMSRRVRSMMVSAVSGGEVPQESFVDEARRRCTDVSFLGLQNGRQRRILVVDDSAICTTMLCKSLQKVGYATDTANNGKEALKLLEIQPCMFDAVIMDIVMPILNGIQATKAIRKELHLKNLPIIVLTADVAEETRVDAMAAGATEFMLKPAYTKSIIKLLHSKGLFAQVPESA